VKGKIVLIPFPLTDLTVVHASIKLVFGESLKYTRCFRLVG